MSFDFLGTFNKAQFERFVEFARGQVELVDSRISYLRAERTRIGEVFFNFDKDGTPRSISVDPTDSYIGRLLAAYEVNGGNPFIELRLRALGDPIYLEPGDEARPAHTMSNGEIVGQPGLNDGLSANLMRGAREFLDEVLAHRHGRLERKIRRALDYYDQLFSEEVALILAKGATTEDFSLEWYLEQLRGLLNDPRYEALTNGSDNLGREGYAPYSSYKVPTTSNPRVNREADQPQRQDGVVVRAGRKSTA